MGFYFFEICFELQVVESNNCSFFRSDAGVKREVVLDRVFCYNLYLC